MDLVHEAEDWANEVLFVHVTNAQDLRPAPTSVMEHEAEHYDCSAFTLPVTIPNTGIQPVLQLDPLRKSAVLIFNGPAASQAIICHSEAQAQRVALGSVTDGAPVTLPIAPFTVSGTAALWIMPVAGAAIVVGIVAERRA